MPLIFARHDVFRFYDDYARLLRRFMIYAPRRLRYFFFTLLILISPATHRPHAVEPFA